MPFTSHRRRCARIPSPGSTADVSFLSLLNTELQTREPFCHLGLLLLVHSLDFLLFVWIGSATTPLLLQSSLRRELSCFSEGLCGSFINGVQLLQRLIHILVVYATMLYKANYRIPLSLGYVTLCLI